MLRKILLVEDDVGVALVVETALASEHYVVDICTTAAAAKAALKVAEYDLLILDWKLPDDMTGLEICQKYRFNGGSKPVMMLTAHTERADIIAGFEAGLDDYMVKPFDPEELIMRVKALLRRPANLQSEVLRLDNLELNTATFRAYKNGELMDLLPKEFAILELLMRHADHYFTAEAILSRVWRTDAKTSTDSVRTFMKTLRKKLEDKNQKWHIENKRGLGYRLALMANQPDIE